MNDSQENLWIGTYSGGLYRWTKNGQNNFEKKRIVAQPNSPNSLSDNIIRSLLEDSKGNIWVGTGGGLCKIPVTERVQNEPKFTVFKHNDKDSTSLSHNYILALYES